MASREQLLPTYYPSIERSLLEQLSANEYIEVFLFMSQREEGMSQTEDIGYLFFVPLQDIENKDSLFQTWKEHIEAADGVIFLSDVEIGQRSIRIVTINGTIENVQIRAQFTDTDNTVEGKLIKSLLERNKFTFS